MKLLIQSFLKKNYLLLGLGVCLQIIANICTIIIPLSYQYLIDTIILNNSFNRLPFYVICIILIFLLFLLTDIISNKIFINQMIEFKKVIKKRIMSNLLKSEDEALVNATKGEVVTRLTQDMEVITNFWAEYLLALLMGIGEFLIIIFVIFKIHYVLGLISLAAAPLFYLMTKKASKNIGAASTKIRESSEQFLNKVDECLDSRETVKMYDCFKYEFERYIKVLDPYMENSKWFMNITLLSKKLIGGLSILFPLIILLSGSLLISYKEITLGSLISVLSSLNYILAPSSLLSNSFIAFKQVKVSYVRLLPFLEEKVEKVEKVEKGNDGSIEESSLNPNHISSVSAYISVNNLYFRFGEKEVLHNITFEVCKNEFISVIGENGIGKSTLINILSGLLEPDQGQVIINELMLNKKNINNIRNGISIVRQKEFLFEDTILNNILFCKTDVLNEKAKKLIEGIQTYSDAGKNGLKLSGGEIQKVAIARAIQKNSNIFLIDEGSTNFDKLSRENLYEILKLIKGKKTVIIIDHHLSYINLCDKVLYMESKEKLFFDKHETLLNSNSSYRSLSAGIKPI